MRRDWTAARVGWCFVACDDGGTPKMTRGRGSSGSADQAFRTTFKLLSGRLCSVRWGARLRRSRALRPCRRRGGAAARCRRPWRRLAGRRAGVRQAPPPRLFWPPPRRRTSQTRCRCAWHSLCVFAWLLATSSRWWAATRALASGMSRARWRCTGPPATCGKARRSCRSTSSCATRRVPRRRRREAVVVAARPRGLAAHSARALLLPPARRLTRLGPRIRVRCATPAVHRHPRGRHAAVAAGRGQHNAGEPLRCAPLC